MKTQQRSFAHRVGPLLTALFLATVGSATAWASDCSEVLGDCYTLVCQSTTPTPTQECFERCTTEFQNCLKEPNYYFTTAARAAARAEVAQAAQADVQIQTITVTQVGNTLTSTVVVFSNNDDDALNVSVRVLLPVETRVLKASGPLGCTWSRPGTGASGSVQAFVDCNLGDMTVGVSRTVKVTTTLPPLGVNKTFGAFASSLSSDANPNNNLGSATAP